MENWGLIKYRENAMIYNENYEDIPHTQILSGVRVISHEV
jgi:aminopeptidase N